MRGMVILDKDRPMLGRVDMNDYPEIDWDTEDGKDQLSMLGFRMHSKYPILGHLLFMSDGEQICEMMFDKPFQKKN